MARFCNPPGRRRSGGCCSRRHLGITLLGHRTVGALRKGWTHDCMLRPDSWLHGYASWMLDEHDLRVHERLGRHLVGRVRVRHGHVLVNSTWHRLPV